MFFTFFARGEAEIWNTYTSSRDLSPARIRAFPFASRQNYEHLQFTYKNSQTLLRMYYLVYYRFSCKEMYRKVFTCKGKRNSGIEEHSISYCPHICFPDRFITLSKSIRDVHHLFVCISIKVNFLHCWATCFSNSASSSTPSHLIFPFITPHTFSIGLTSANLTSLSSGDARSSKKKFTVFNATNFRCLRS